MILVSRLQGQVFYLNPDMIEFIEETPDLVISLISGKKLVVEGSAEELIEKVIAYRHRSLEPIPLVINRKPLQEMEPGRIVDTDSRR